MKEVPYPDDGDSSAAETGTSGGEIVHFIKPRRRKQNNGEPTYQISIRPRVSTVSRFNKLGNELRVSNAELLEMLLDIYDRENLTL